MLSQAAIAHAQFESIHPFPDGNGRTGRALIHAMLRGHGLTMNVWDVVLLGTDMDAVARHGILGPVSRLFCSQDVVGGPSLAPLDGRAGRNKRRLDFITAKLEHDPPTAESLD